MIQIYYKTHTEKCPGCSAIHSKLLLLLLHCGNGMSGAQGTTTWREVGLASITV